MDKRFFGFLLIVVVILGTIFWFSGGKSPSSTSSTQPTNHVEGQGQDKVTLLEYGDYECPYCGQYYPIVKQVQQEYNTQVYFQFRNLPLTQIHQNAFAGARAAEAADLQGKFWQMHDALYENQTSWVSSTNPETYFESYAQNLGLNLSKFKQDYAGSVANNRINADVTAFDKTGAQEATPTFFLDGKQINPSESVASFETLINAAIKSKGFTPPAPTAAPSTAGSTATPQSTQ